MGSRSSQALRVSVTVIHSLPVQDSLYETDEIREHIHIERLAVPDCNDKSWTISGLDPVIEDLKIVIEKLSSFRSPCHCRILVFCVIVMILRHLCNENL